ncbi:lipid-A-disaccharide synthase [Hydrogenophaga sp.]|uniref:lipid-A-disaccharide synthase n=1 Tax=Hydrogenophaga sp. TaxID=1904254 RepID=UPI0025C1A52A|nr:lipid-A-disaccharide synthase [Hydrogenophaga sp.]
MNTAPHLALVAGEASGDLLAGLLLGGMRQRWPDLRALGIGGPRMAEQGFQAWWPSDKLAVHGYVEALRHYREIVSIRAQLKQRLLGAERPDLFIGVDAPDFNLDLQADLRAAGIRTVQFICPAVWAWRAKRIEKIRRSVDHVLCVFPFEPDLLARHGVAATYVGHPLASVIPIEPDRAAARRALGLGEHETVLAILPGSRASEVRYLTPLFFAAAALLLRQRPALRLVVPTLPALRDRVEAAARAAGVSAPLLLLSGQSHRVLAACDLALVASGTATLEAALFKRPMVIAYRMNGLSWLLMRGKQLQPWIGLPNILCQDFVVPERVQDAASPQALAQALLGWLEAPERILALQQRFIRLHHELRRNTASLATDAIEKMLAQ